MSTRFWFRLHSFTGVVTGLLLFVICWSGTFAVVANELDWLVNPSERVVAGDEVTSWGAIIGAVKAEYPDAAISLLQAPLYARGSAKVRVDKPNQNMVWVHVDPYTAEVKGTSSFLTIQRFFREMHFHFFGGRLLHYLVMMFSITLLASMLAALSFYRRWWRALVRLPQGNGRAFWSDFHKSAGVWSLWFVIVMVVTGVWYLVEQYRVDFGDGVASFAGAGGSAVVDIPDAKPDLTLAHVPIDQLFSIASKVRPDLRPDQIYLDDLTAVFWGQAGSVLVRDRANQLHLDRRTTEVLYDQSPHDYTIYWRWADTADPLHFGDFGGLWSKVIWFVFGVILSGLILTGTWLHAYRLVHGCRGQSRYRWPGTSVAILISLLVVAISVPNGITKARGYGPVIDGVQRLPDLPFGVSAVIIGWVSLTTLIILAWSLVLYRPQVVLCLTGKTATQRVISKNREAKNSRILNTS